MSFLARKLMTGEWSDENIPIHRALDSGSPLLDPAGAFFASPTFPISGTYLGTPETNSKIFIFVAPKAFELPQNLTNSKFSCMNGQANFPALPSNTTFNIYKNSTHIGSLIFKTDSSVEIDFTNSVTFATGETLSIIAPATTVNGITYPSWTIEGNNIKDYASTPEIYFAPYFNAGTLNGYDIRGGTDVIIPSTIGGIPVSHVGDNAFASITPKLTTVIVPEGVTSIGHSAFSNQSLASVKLPTTLLSIGESAFANNQINQIKLPENLATIGPFAFSRNKLYEVIIPNSVTSMGEYAFFSQQGQRLFAATLGQGVSLINLGTFSDNILIKVVIGNGVEIRTTSLEPSMGLFGENLKTAYDSSGQLGGDYTYYSDGIWNLGNRTVQEQKILVAEPVTGNTPETGLFNHSECFGTIDWFANGGTTPIAGTFTAATVYTAIITLIPKPTYTLSGVSENFFTVQYGDMIADATNNANSGIVTAIFPATT